MCPPLHYERGQLIQPCLFNPFNNNRIHFLFCNNSSKSLVLFMYSHYVYGGRKLAEMYYKKPGETDYEFSYESS